MAQSQDDPALLLEAYEATGLTLFYSGELTHARTSLEQSMALYNPCSTTGMSCSTGVTLERFPLLFGNGPLLTWVS